MTTFVDRVELHAAAGNGATAAPPYTVRSSSRWAAPTGATAVAGAT